MKNYYKINEISKLYGIGPDSLRYYEKLGVLKPHRDTNGYRLYNLKDMYKLNIIRDLRRLDFSMQQIREYLDGQSVENTLDLLDREDQLLEQNIRELQKRRRVIRSRIQMLQEAQHIETAVISEKMLPRRACVRLRERITRDEEMDFMIIRLYRRHEDIIRDLGTQTIGAFLSVEDMEKGVANVYDAVFFVLDRMLPDADLILPAGRYLSSYYRGGYGQNAARVADMLAYARAHGLTPVGAPFELYEVDNRDTIREEEFLTEIQLQVIEQ